MRINDFHNILELVKQDILQSEAEYLKLLKVVGNNQKYDFRSQLSIYDKNPEATACAKFDYWRERFGRTVMRGQKGIPILEDYGTYKKVDYIFDISQTVSKNRDVNEVNLWRFDKEAHRDVLKEMIKAEGYEESESTLENIFSLSKLYGDEKIDSLMNELRISDEDRISFTKFARDSVSYAVASRFKLDYEYISIYHDLQGEKARALKPYASNKKMAADLRRFSKAIYYLRDNKLQTIADLQEKIGTLQAENKNINQEVKVKSKRIENLNKCFTYADIIKDNKATYEEWNNKTLFKDSFYNSHKEEIDKYKRARKMIEQFTGSSAIKSKDWQKEMKTLEDEITKLNKHSQAIKEEYENINHIKYAVKIVNDDYGIDLSIEIDKAIKRGEKPSVIGQIKKYQEQQEKYEKKKEKTKDYYRNEER